MKELSSGEKKQFNFMSLCAHIILVLMVNRFGLMSAMEGPERDCSTRAPIAPLPPPTQIDDRYIDR